MLNLIKSLESAPDGTHLKLLDVLQAIPWNSDGLIPAIAQEHITNKVLMLAWMNKDSLLESLSNGQVCYWSRSRNQLWYKGSTSGNTQHLVSAYLDCDGDSLLLLVQQKGPPCHTGRPSCFYNHISNNGIHVRNDPI